MLKYTHPVLAAALHYWPTVILLPTILAMIVTLAMVTRWWDDRDAASRPHGH